MKKNLIPALLLTLSYICFLTYLATSSAHLPDRVATHFDLRGLPDGWMSRSVHLILMAALGAALPLSIVGLSYVGRYLPHDLINLPRRDYWLAPERRGEALNYIFRQSLWFGCLLVCFLVGLQFAVVQANAQSPARLPVQLSFWMLGCFLVGTFGWTVNLLRHFSRSGA